MPDTTRVWVDSSAHAGRYLRDRQAVIAVFIGAPADYDQWVAVQVSRETADATIDAAIDEGNLVSIDLFTADGVPMANIRLHADESAPSHGIYIATDY